jgi:hypothetical protein
MKNVMKLMMCAGFFCSANFGMQKEVGLYVECGDDYYYRSIKKDGSLCEIDDAMLTVLKLSPRFKGGSLAQSKAWKYYVQGGQDYALHVAVQREGGVRDIPLSLKSSDCSIPIELTEAQVKKVVELRRDRRNIFVTDQYNARLNIESFSFRIEGILEHLRIDAIKKEEADNARREEDRLRSEKAWRERSASEDKCACLFTICLLGCGSLLMIGGPDILKSKF